MPLALRQRPSGLRAQFGYEVCAAKVGGNSKSYGHPQRKTACDESRNKSYPESEASAHRAPSQKEVSASAERYQN
jgi:hypothetical protein